MTGGLRGTASLMAIAALSCVMGATVFVAKPAKAADLGGDCCADLEERVAELEATTVRKGNKKVIVELYGRMNRVGNFWDDGVESNFYMLNNSYSSTRFGVRGKAKIGGEWSSGYTLEIEDGRSLSKFVDQFNDNFDNSLTGSGLTLRRSAMYVDNKKLGRVWWGLWSTAKDDITKDNIVIKGLDQTMHADFYMNWSFFLRPKGTGFNNAEGMSTIRFRDIGRCYSTSSSAFDCSTRRNLVRYDTPDWYGFILSAAYGEDDIWSAAVRYNKEWGENWKVGFGYAYEDFTDEGFNAGGGGVPFQGFRRDMKEWAGSFSIINNPTGLFLWGANSNSQDDDTNAFGIFTGRRPPVYHSWDIAGGLHREFFEVGKTTLWGGHTWDEDGIGSFTRNSGNPSRSVWDGQVDAYTSARSGLAIPGIPFRTEITGSETTKWYLAVDQAIDSAALNLYAAYQHISPEISLVTRELAFSPKGKLKSVPVAFEDFDTFWMGGRIQF